MGVFTEALHPRVPVGHGRESGEFTDANKIATVAKRAVKKTKTKAKKTTGAVSKDAIKQAVALHQQLMAERKMVATARALRGRSKAPDKLTESQWAAVASYTMNDYKDINGHLRGDAHYRAIPDRIKKRIPELDSLMKPTATTQTVYRKMYGDLPIDVHVGAVLKDPAFMSTTRDMAVLNKLSGVSGKRGQQRTIFEITVPAGTRAFRILPEHTGLSVDEQELLLARDTALRIDEVRTATGSRGPAQFIKATVVS